jgi:transcriptional regulator with XRE-family HTH domain
MSDMPASEAGAKRRLGQPRRRRVSAASPRKPTAVDKHVGKRLRLLRQMRELSLERLAEIVEVAPQQIQKYEIGETRISASRIFDLARVLSVPLSWFYADLKSAASTETAAHDDRAEQLSERPPSITKPDASDPSQGDLLATYYELLPPEMREKLVDIARILSEAAVKRPR